MTDPKTINVWTDEFGHLLVEDGEPRPPVRHIYRDGEALCGAGSEPDTRQREEDR